MAEFEECIRRKEKTSTRRTYLVLLAVLSVAFLCTGCGKRVRESGIENGNVYYLDVITIDSTNIDHYIVSCSDERGRRYVESIWFKDLKEDAALLEGTVRFRISEGTFYHGPPNPPKQVPYRRSGDANVF